MANKEKILTVTIKDCKVEYFRGSGGGGQHKNKTDSCVRITHQPSGAVGLGTEDRSQHVNKRTAFKRMATSKAFQQWLRIENARILHALAGLKPVEQIVDELMEEKNLRVESKSDKGMWEPYKENDQ